MVNQQQVLWPLCCASKSAQKQNLKWKKIFVSSHCVRFSIDERKALRKRDLFNAEKALCFQSFLKCGSTSPTFQSTTIWTNFPRIIGMEYFYYFNLFTCFSFFMIIFICSRFKQIKDVILKLDFFFFVNRRKLITTLTSLHFMVRRSKLPKPTNHWKIILANKTHNLLILLLHSSFGVLQKNNHKHGRAWTGYIGTVSGPKLIWCRKIFTIISIGFAFLKWTCNVINCCKRKGLGI